MTPVFNGELRSHKPVMLYWFMMTAYSVLGVNEFAARFWSAALAIGACLCTYAIGSRLFTARVGLWSAVILATTMMFDVAARAATPDSVLIFFGTLALTWYVLRAFPKRDEQGDVVTAEPELQSDSSFFPKSWAFAAVLYGIMGIGVLTKGPIGVVLPTAVIGLFLLIRCFGSRYGSPAGLSKVIRPFTYFVGTCWRMRIVSATLIVLAVSAPWYVWVGFRTDGAWLQGFFLEHKFGRAMQAMEGHHGNSLFFYPIALMLGFAPWSVFFVPTAIETWRRIRAKDPQSDGLLFAACWVLVYVGLFSIARTKLPSYVTPCYPGIALLVGFYVDKVSLGETLAHRIWPRIAFVLWALIGVALMVGLPIAAARYLPNNGWLGAIGTIPLVAAAIGLTCFRMSRPDVATRAFAMGAFLFVWAAFSFVAVRVDSAQKFDELLAALDQKADAPTIAYYQTLEPSWVFYHESAIKPVYLGEPNAPYAQGEHSGSVWVRHPQAEAREFLSESKDHFVITTPEHYERIKSELPPSLGVVAETPYFLKDHTVVAIGQARSDVASQNGSPRER